MITLNVKSCAKESLIGKKCHAVTLIIFDRQLNLKAFFPNPISSVTTGGWTFGINFTTLPIILRLNPNEGSTFALIDV